MALRKCKECGKEVSSKASACPNCGAPVKKAPTQYGCGGCLGFLLIGVVLLSIIGHFLPESASPPRAPETSEQRSEREAREPKDRQAKEQQAQADQQKKAATDAIVAAKTEKFKKWALANTAVTDISINGITMFVTLTSDKYTNRDNVRVIAETLARYYATQVGLDYAACHVYFGNEEYAVGRFHR